MARRLVIESAERAEYLEKRLKQAKSVSQKERLPMLGWLKTGQLTQHQQLSERLGRSPATLTRWLSKYRNGGLPELLSLKTAPGAQSKIQGEALAKLQQRLSSPAGFRRDGAIALVVRPRVRSQAQVRYGLRQKLKAKLKVPRPVSAKQAATAVATFQNTSDSR